jgi:hypothetical protein
VASYAGGTAYGCRLCNCIVDVGCDASTLNYCCGGNPTSGVGNITNNPLFVDCANGNLRLQPNSPCINAGNNGYVASANELEGRPRIIGRTVDMGAYEFQLGVSGAFIGWLQQYGLPTTGPADHTDPDLDGMNNWQEWVCGTCPTNAQSVLRVVSALPTSTNDRELAERGRGELLPIAEHQSRVAVHVPGPKYRRAGSYQRTGKDCFC